MPKSRGSKISTAAVSGSVQPLHLQVAALCWRRSKKGLRILLITSRDTGRWVIPKGWPMRNRSDAEAAAREAFEEAGLRGTVSQHSIGVYTYRKAVPKGRRVQIAVRVFPMEVHEMLKKYPETGQRRAKWFDPAQAARGVAEPELKQLIRDFAAAGESREPHVAVERRDD